MQVHIPHLSQGTAQFQHHKGPSHYIFYNHTPLTLPLPRL